MKTESFWSIIIAIVVIVLGGTTVAQAQQPDSAKGSPGAEQKADPEAPDPGATDKSPEADAPDVDDGTSGTTEPAENTTEESGEDAVEPGDEPADDGASEDGDEAVESEDSEPDDASGDEQTESAAESTEGPTEEASEESSEESGEETPVESAVKEEKSEQDAGDEKADPTRSSEAAEKFESATKAIDQRTYSPWKEINDTKFDWARTTSGEWLKGEIKDLRDGDFRIDSDEFDMQTLDWEDIAELHSPNSFTLVLDDKSVQTGSIELAEKKIIVNTANGPRVFEMDNVMTMIPEKRTEISKWSLLIAAGASGSIGNTEAVDFSGRLRIRRESVFNRTTLEYRGTYGLVDKKTNTNRHVGDAIWNIFVSPIFYITPYYGQGLYDKFKNIEFQLITAAGIGFHAVKAKKVTLDLELDGGYAYTRYLSVEPGADSRDDTALVIPRLIFEWDITGDIEFNLAWSTAMAVNDISKSFHEGSSELTIEISEIFDFEIGAVYSRRESPVTTEDGLTPKKDDLSVTIGIQLEFE